MWKEYWKPTPKLFRKIGDSIMTFGAALTVALAGMEVDKGWVIFAAVCGPLGKVLSNFFTDDDLPK